MSLINRADAPPKLSHHNELLKSLEDLSGREFCQAILNSTVDINEILIAEINLDDSEFKYNFSTALNIACYNNDLEAVEALLKHGAHATRYSQLPDGSTGSWKSDYVSYGVPQREPHILNIFSDVGILNVFTDVRPSSIGIGREHIFLPVSGGSLAELVEEHSEITYAIAELQKDLLEMQNFTQRDGDRVLSVEELKKVGGGVAWFRKPTLSEMCESIDKNIKSKRKRQFQLHSYTKQGQRDAETIRGLLRTAANKEMEEAIKSKNAPEWMKISALFLAIKKNDLSVVQKLLDAGVSLDAGGPGGSTAIGLAINLSNAKVLDLLVNAGAKLDIACAWEPRITRRAVNYPSFGYAPLPYAVGCGWIEGVRILLKHGLGALTGSLNNRDLGDLKKYKLVRLDRMFDGSPGGGLNDSPGSEGCGFVFVGQSHWSNPGLGSPLRWAVDVMKPPHVDHWPERSSRSHRELLKLLGNACIEEINALRTNSKHPLTSNWPEILNNIIRYLPFGEVGTLLGGRWEEAENFILGSVSEEISTSSGRAALAVQYAKHVYGGHWAKAIKLGESRNT